MPPSVTWLVDKTLQNIILDLEEITSLSFIFFIFLYFPLFTGAASAGPEDRAWLGYRIWKYMFHAGLEDQEIVAKD